MSESCPPARECFHWLDPRQQSRGMSETVQCDVNPFTSVFVCNAGMYFNFVVGMCMFCVRLVTTVCCCSGIGRIYARHMLSCMSHTQP